MGFYNNESIDHFIDTLRIVSADISSFAGSNDVVLPDLDAPIVCIAGPNEAGKSTLRSFLVSMLFGFPPKSSRKLLAPDTGADITGRLKFRTADGCDYVVARRAGQTVDGTLESGDGLFSERLDLGNDPVPQVDKVSKSIFESVHALTLAEMVGLDAKKTGEVREVLLGSMNLPYIMPVHAIIEGLEKEAASYWRSDNRGKPESVRISAELDEVRERMTKVEAGEIEIEVLVDLGPRLDGELSETQARLREVEVALDELLRLLPLSQDLDRLVSLQRESEAVAEYDTLPDDVAELLTGLRGTVLRTDQKIVQARNRMALLTRQVDQFDGRMRALVAKADGIRELAGSLTETRSVIAALAQRRLELVDIERRYRSARATLFVNDSDGEVEWTTGHTEHLEMLNANRDLAGRQLASAVTNAEAYASFGRDGLRILAGGAVLQAPLLIVGLLVLVSSGFAIAASVVSGGVVASALGVLAGLFGYGRWRKARRAIYGLDLEQLQRAVSGADESVVEALEHMHLRAAVADVGPELFSRIEEFEGIARTRVQVQEIIRKLEGDLQRVLDLAASLELFTDRDLENPVVAIELVSQELRRAEECEVRAESAAHELSDAESLCNELISERAHSQDRIDSVEGLLQLLGDGSIDEGIERLARGRRAQRDLSLLSTGIEQRFSTSDRERLEELQADGMEIQNRIERYRSQLKDLRSGLSELTERRAKQAARLEQLRSGERAVDVRLELDELLARRQAVKDKRDRLILLRNVIAVANRRFRESHEPNVLARASEYLSRATSGRWVRLRIPVAGELDVVDARGKTIKVASTASTTFVSRLSRGTLDQIFLCLRLGIIDHIDGTWEKLPVFLDEILVNWDLERRKNIYPVLRAVSEVRQVFFFTCHEWMREELAVQLGAHIVDLPSVGERRVDGNNTNPSHRTDSSLANETLRPA